MATSWKYAQMTEVTVTTRFGDFYCTGIVADQEGDLVNVNVDGAPGINILAPVGQVTAR